MEVAGGGHIWLSPYIKEVLLQSLGNAGHEGSMTTKGKDNHFLVEKKSSSKGGLLRLSCVLAKNQPQTTNSEASKDPWLSSPAPPREVPAARTS